MALTIYEVVAGGNGEDWSVLVAARSPAEARDIACFNQPRMDYPWVIFEWGTDARENVEPGILRGPFQDYPAVNRGGWKQYKEDWDSKIVPRPIIEWRSDDDTPNRPGAGNNSKFLRQLNAKECLDFSALKKGQIAVIQTDRTGIVLAPDGQRYLGSGEAFRSFDSLAGARAFAQSVVASKPEVECGLYDSSGAHLERITSARP